VYWDWGSGWVEQPRTLVTLECITCPVLCIWQPWCMVNARHTFHIRPYFQLSSIGSIAACIRRIRLQRPVIFEVLYCVKWELAYQYTGYFEFMEKRYIQPCATKYLELFNCRASVSACVFLWCHSRLQHPVPILLLSGSVQFAISQISAPYNVTRSLLHEINLFVSLTNFTFTKWPT
jgi:hypothetical protein